MTQDKAAKKVQAGIALGGCFLAIGLALFALALALFLHMRSESDIGQRLVDEGVETQALLVSAELRERLSCRGGAIKACRRSDIAVGRIVYLVGNRRALTDISLTQDEFTDFEANEEVRVAIVYLEDAPLELERSRGARLASAQSQVLSIIVLLAFGVTFSLIGGGAVLVGRKQARDPSTGRDD